jgi:epoxyqueuosine reductase
MEANLKSTLSEIAESLGVDLFRIVAADRFEDAPEGHRPRDVMPDVKSILILGIKYLDSQLDILPSREGDAFFTQSPRQQMFAGHSDLISQRLDEIGYTVARSLERHGFKAYHQMASAGGVDQRYLTGLLSLKHLAARAGLGVFGYHSLIITPQYGPRVRLAAILTDAKMESDSPLNESFCESCVGTPCIALCPAKALTKPANGSFYQINKYACQQYLTTRPACTICMKVCPTWKSRMVSIRAR